MKIKNTILTVSAVGVLVSALVLAKNIFAYQGDYTKKGPNCTPERHEAMEQAFENNDYQAWKELRNGKGRVAEVINESNFAQFAQAHKLAEEGDYEEADKSRQELGLRSRGRGQVGARHQGRNNQGRRGEK